MGICGGSSALFLALAFAFVRCGYGQDTIFPAIMVFGDSVVDVGNNNHLPTPFKANYPPYGRDFPSHEPTGRFCNGKLAIDYTAEALGFKTCPPAYFSPEASGRNLLIGANFASAAAGFDNKASTRHHAITLSQQLEHFKEYKIKLAKVAGLNRSALIIRNALYILGAGDADFVQNYYINPSLRKVYTPDQYASYVVNSFSSFVKELYGLGARKLGATSLPPVGCFPAARTLFQYRGKGCDSKINGDAERFNKKFNLTAATLQKQLPGLKIVVFDIFKPLYDVIVSPSKYGFVETRRSCCGTGGTAGKASVLCNPKLRSCSNATQYVFWDSVHPSQAANRILADALIFQGLTLV